MIPALALTITAAIALATLFILPYHIIDRRRRREARRFDQDWDDEVRTRRARP
ncbi:MAG: hypothetical protein ACI4X9_04050 [Kiritimatiellia bacterium]